MVEHLSIYLVLVVNNNLLRLYFSDEALIMKK